MLSTDPIVLVSGFLSGIVVGSFLNVLIYRLPREQSVVGGRSMCTSCKNTIGWFDNVPIVSYVFLRGQCRHCGERISATYPVVEILSGVAAALVIYRYGLTLKALWMYCFLAILLVITFIDWAHQIIPDVLSIGGVVLGWVGSLICLDVDFVGSLIGSVVGGGLLLLIAVFYKAVRKVDGMGGGDIKLMAMIGAFLGWQMVFPVLFLASFVGSIYGIILMRKGGTAKSAVAFGSFLAPAATVVLLIGRQISQYYLGR